MVDAAAYSCLSFQKKTWEFRADVKIDFPQEALEAQKPEFCALPIEACEVSCQVSSSGPIFQAP
jgi:hypothetical protein